MTAKDVLIRSAPGPLDHKRADQLDPNEEAFWRVSGTPRQTEPGRRVWFAQDGQIHACAEITACEDGRLWFDGVQRTSREPPRDAPARGFTYIEPLE